MILWNELRSICRDYATEFRLNPFAPVTANQALHKRLLEFVQEAEKTGHPAAQEIMYLAGGQYVTLRPLEALRVLGNLRQRMRPNDKGRELVGEVAFDLRPRTYPMRNVALAGLAGELREVADLVGFPHFSGFQVESWQQIMAAIKQRGTVMLTAPTGAGKTEAFMLPLVYDGATNDRHFIIIYPRRELIKDQIGRLLRMVARANEGGVAHQPAIIGVQLGGIQNALQDTLWYPSDGMPNVRCLECGKPLRKIGTGSWVCACPNRYLPPARWHLPKWKFLGREWKYDHKASAAERPQYLSYIDSLAVEWPEVLTCPNCGDTTALQAPARDFIDADSESKARPVQFSCPTCGLKAPVTLGKEQHLRVRPNFLVTNVESLDKLLLDPRYAEAGYFRSIDGIALDEVHVYFQLYGAHVHHLLRRVEKHKGSPCALIGCSATIPDAADFGGRLFGRPIDFLVEANDPKFTQEILSAEYFLFLRVPDQEQIAAMSTMLQTVMALGHSVLPATAREHSGTQVMVFSDSLDVILRAESQMKDAEQRRLYNYRLKDKFDGEYECVGLDRCRCPMLPDGTLCQTYAQGECWRLFWAGDLREQPMDVTSVSARKQGGVQAARESDVIISSPSLEVGVDIPGVGATVHYKTPRAVFSFIQRKGRAGRRPGQFPFTVAVLAGDDPMDAFTFQQFDRLVQGLYRLPLNAENPLIRSIHADYLDGTFSGPIMQTYTDLTTADQEFQRFPQKALQPTGWTVVRGLAKCPRWTDDLKFVLPPEVKRGDGYDYVGRYLETQVAVKRKEIADLVAEFGRPVEDRSALLSNIEKAQAELISRIPEGLRESAQFQLLWNDLSTHVLGISSLVSQAQSLVAAKDNIVDEINELETALLMLKKWINSQPLNTAEARSSILTIVSEANRLLNQIENAGLLAAGDRVSDLRYQVAALEKLLKGLEYKMPAEIVKKYQQAQFYLCWSCPRWDNCHLDSKMHHYIPDAFFDSPASLVVEVDGRRVEEPGFMLYSNYIPYKIFYRFGETPVTVNAVATPAGMDGKGTPQVDVALEGMEGIFDFFGDKPYFLPRRIQARLIEPTDQQAGNRFGFCTTCFNLSYDASGTCVCGSPVREGSLFSAPIVRRRFLKRDTLAKKRRLVHCQLDGLTQLTGADVTFRTAKTERNFRARYAQPLGYRYETRGLVLRLDDVLVEAWNAYQEPEGARDHVIRRAAETAQALWPPAAPTFDSFADTMLHTSAHMLMKSIAAMCGVNEESLEYAWDTEEGAVAVWEKVTGGAGITDLYMDYLLTSAADVYDSLVRTVGCPTCGADGRDGCPDDVWISYCQAGRRDQPLAVSQSLGALLLACLTTRLTGANRLKLGDKLVVAADDDSKTVVTLDF